MNPDLRATILAGTTLQLVTETVVCGVPAYHTTCTGCPGWRCHRQAHHNEETAARCAQRHAARHA